MYFKLIVYFTSIYLFIYLCLLLLCCMGVYCSIYKGSYNVSNISYLNSSRHCSPSSSLPDSWNYFNRYHFCIYIHVYTLFAPYSSSYPFPCHLCPTTCAKSPTHSGQTCFALLFSDFAEEKKDNKRN
jgi:hypothetical protein